MKIVLSFVIFLWISCVCVASPNLLSTELETFRQQGSNALMNLDYEGAKLQYEQMIATDPGHPAGYVYLAHAMWQNHLLSLRRLQTGLYSKTDAFFRESNEEVDPVVDKQFQKLIRTSMQLSETKLAKNRYDIAAMYYLGMAQNTLAGYEATVKRTFYSALKHGSKGVKWHKKAVKLDPSFIDAKMSIGLYEYVLGSLPLFVKIIVFFSGSSGSKREGVRLLEQVYRGGSYSRIEAGVVLMMLYERQERYEDALKIIEDLLRRHPNNYLFQLERANLYVDLNRVDEGRQFLDALLKDPGAYEYMPDLLHFRYAETLAKGGYWSQAYEHYNLAAASRGASENLITMARLGAAKSLDAMKSRDQAKSEYSQILKRKDFLDSHDQAKAFLKKPFHP